MGPGLGLMGRSPPPSFPRKVRQQLHSFLLILGRCPITFGEAVGEVFQDGLAFGGEGADLPICWIDEAAGFFGEIDRFAFFDGEFFLALAAVDGGGLLDQRGSVIIPVASVAASDSVKYCS